VSQENVEVVRRFNAAHDGEDVAHAIRQSSSQLGEDPSPEAILEVWANDPGWRYAHPEIEFDNTAALFGRVARGPREIARWWLEWTEDWESYVYRVREYRDLGDWVLTRADVKARSRNGVPVAMEAFQIWQVRDGRVAVNRAFLSEHDALEAAGVSA
jgi:ketosteroid isomerase-like protein